MNKFKILLLMIFSTISVSVFAQKTADDFIGKWKTQDEGAIINIVKKNGKIAGYDPNGKTVIWNFTVSDGKWKVDLYDSRKDMTATGEVVLQGDKLKIVAKKGFITKTMFWIKN